MKPKGLVLWRVHNSLCLFSMTANRRGAWHRYKCVLMEVSTNSWLKSLLCCSVDGICYFFNSKNLALGSPRCIYLITIGAHPRAPTPSSSRWRPATGSRQSKITMRFVWWMQAGNCFRSTWMSKGKRFFRTGFCHVWIQSDAATWDTCWKTFQKPAVASSPLADVLAQAWPIVCLTHKKWSLHCNTLMCNHVHLRCTVLFRSWRS